MRATPADLTKKSSHDSLEQATQWVKIHHRGARLRGNPDEGGAAMWIDGDECVAVLWTLDDGKWQCAMKPIKYMRW